MAIYLGNTPIAENITIQQGGGVEIDDTSSTATDKTWSVKKISESVGVGKAGTGKNAEIFNNYKDNDASGIYSHAEGHTTTASGHGSHAEGTATTASGLNAHAGGHNAVAGKICTFAHGENVEAISNDYEVAFGAFNKSNTDTLFSIGNGTDENKRSNAFEITKTTGKLFDKEIATKEDIPTTLPANGGNADTLDGKSVSEFLQNIGGLTSGSLLEYALTLSASGWLVAGPNVTDTPNPGKTFFVEVRNYNGYLELVACQTGTNTVSVNNYDRENWFGWHNVSDNGNAASVGTYTEAKLAALEARVAVLEGGT